MKNKVKQIMTNFMTLVPGVFVNSYKESMLNNIKISMHEIVVVFKQNTEDNFQAKLYTILP